MSNTEVTTKEPEVPSTPTIIAPATTRVKDPRRVAQGKKLAETSKAAKAAKKKRLLEEATVHEGGGDPLLSYPILFGTIGAVVGIGGLYLVYKDSIWRKKTAVVVENIVENPTKGEKKVGKPKERLINLEGFD
jgi:hypothetical protein